MSKETLDKLLTNDTLIRNIEIGISKILEGNSKEEVITVISTFSKNMNNLLFSASQNDIKIDKSIQSLKKIADYSMEPGYPGSFLAFAINTIRENNFIIEGGFQNIISDTVENRLKNLKDDLKNISGMKNNTLEEIKWECTDDYAIETIDAILKDKKLKSIFGAEIEKMNEQTDKDIKKEISEYEISTLDDDFDEEKIKKLTDIIKKSNILDTKVKNKSIGLKIKPVISELCNSSKIDMGGGIKAVIADLFWIRVVHDDMECTMTGKLCVEGSKVILKDKSGDVVLNTLPITTKMNLKGKKVIDLCHSRIVIGDKIVKIYTHDSKCCVDNMLKMIGYYKNLFEL